MIQVQIASQLTLHGVDGVRWVLVEVDDTAQLTAPSPTAALAGAPPDGWAVTTASRPPRALLLAVLKLLVTGLGIGAALWVAQVTLGPIHLPGWGPAGTKATPSDRLPTHTLPGAAPTAPPASATEPRVMAVVS